MWPTTVHREMYDAKRLIADGHEVATADQQVDGDSLFGEFPQGRGFAFWARATVYYRMIGTKR